MARYKNVHYKGKMIGEHRLVWELSHGPIKTGYEIHHINKNRFDNRLENLELVKSGEHQSEHFKERFNWWRIGNAYLAKPCATCKKLLPLTEFYRMKNGSLYGRCKKCKIKKGSKSTEGVKKWLMKKTPEERREYWKKQRLKKSNNSNHPRIGSF